ncbi:hypothetical protein IFM89_009583 [Coptis chinensis]|uniref:Uncharacterized protein n=1 Tax=Coptis chinensis TaxID=261450 RepID=A0A835IPA1_9MAGN|nr:hypothetical protein IFM89_009583 [Coptis chinensis]
MSAKLASTCLWSRGQFPLPCRMRSHGRSTRLVFESPYLDLCHVGCARMAGQVSRVRYRDLCHVGCDRMAVVQVMGCATSHITLESALQTHLNVTIIGEEVTAKKQTLKNVTDHITLQM